MKPVTNKFKSGGLHEKHVVATWSYGNHLSVIIICVAHGTHQTSALSQLTFEHLSHPGDPL